MEHKPGIRHAACRWQKDVSDGDLLIIYQLYFFVMGERHVHDKFVLQALELLDLTHLSSLGFKKKFVCPFPTDPKYLGKGSVFFFFFFDTQFYILNKNVQINC